MTELSKYEETLLLEAVAHGDEKAFSRLYLNYESAVRRYVLKLVKLPAIGEDLVQEIFIRVWEARSGLPEIRCFRAFLFTIARNHTLNSLQSIKKSDQALAGLLRHFQSHRADDEALDRDYQQFIEKALNAIPPRSREVFRLCRERTMTYDQAGAELGISRNAVKKHMVNVIRMLKEAAARDLGMTFDLFILLLSLLPVLLR